MNRINHPDPLARYAIADGSTIVAGDLVALNASGKAVPAADAENLRVIGVARLVRDGEVEVETGIFGFGNDTTYALTRASRGNVAYVKSKTTVSANGGTHAVAAGIVVDVYDGEVYVAVDPVAFRAAQDADTTYAAATTAAAGIVKQAAAVADCTSETVTTQLNALLAALRTAGVLAANA